MSQERVVMKPKEAVAMLPVRKSVHTFVNAGGVLLGCDILRDNLIADFNKYRVELSGEVATTMGHGLVYYDGKNYIFVETRDTK